MTLEARLEQLRAAQDLELERLLEAGLCGCGCGTRIDTGGNGRRRYADGHRQRAHRKRVEAEAKVRGVVPRLSLKALAATDPAAKRHPDAQARARKPRRPRRGVSVYYPTAALAERVRALLADRPGAELADEVLEVLEPLDRALERHRRRERPDAPA